MDSKQQQEYLKLLELLILTAGANKGHDAGPNNRYLEIEGLLKKFVGHVASIYFLFNGKGTNLHFENPLLPTDEISFIDSASINVLGRTTLETFLVFHYIFITPRSDDERDFRYFTWMAAELIQRVQLINSPEFEEKRRQDLQTIEFIKSKMQNNPFFNKLSQKERDNFFSGKGSYKDVWRTANDGKGKFKIMSWSKIGLEVGLSKLNAEKVYILLCSYAHSGSTCVLAINDVNNIEEQKIICKSALNVVMIAMAFMIKALCEKFSHCSVVLEKDKIGKAIVDDWIIYGSNEPE
jgi:hypothetical protein